VPGQRGLPSSPARPGSPGARSLRLEHADKRSKESRKVRWERLDEDLTYAAKDLDRSVVVPSQIRTVHDGLPGSA